jgi:hypothetical protein
MMIVVAVPTTSVNALSSSTDNLLPPPHLLGNGDYTTSTSVSYQNGINVLTFTDDQGVQSRVAVKQFSDVIYFWNIESDNDLVSLLTSPEVLALQSPSSSQPINNFIIGAQLDENLQPVGDVSDLGISVEPDSVIVSGKLNLPKGGWVKWTNTTMKIFVSHNLAVFMLTGSYAVAAICGVIAFVPTLGWTGGICAFFWAMTGITINYYDSFGNPGFYVNVTKKPKRIWVTP